jgi:hypothetical protein
MDNLNIHRRKSFTDLGEEVGGEVWGRFTVHYHTHGSWLNQAEIEIAIPSKQGLGTGRISEVAACFAVERRSNGRRSNGRTDSNGTRTGSNGGRTGRTGVERGRTGQSESTYIKRREESSRLRPFRRRCGS